MAWVDLVKAAHAGFLSTWGGDATLAPAELPGQTFAIKGIIVRPGMEEEFTPGSADGVSVIRFWVDLNTVARKPVKGDVMTINGVSYDVGLPDVDEQGGATLKLRRNA